VPGAGADQALAWSPSGRWLYLSAGDQRLRAWRVGAEQALALPLRPGGRVLSIATSAGFSGP
jgi:hypothetical protein